jgi:proteasome lid subunit RPN8/RPN11
MGTATQLVLSSAAWDSIAERVRAADPDEAVGLLGGTTDGRVTHVAPLPNLVGGAAFLADPRAQFEAERACADLRLTPLAAYHSHPRGTPTLSQADKAFAHPRLPQLVVALSREGDLDARAYRVAGGVSEVSLSIEQRPSHA